MVTVGIDPGKGGCLCILQNNTPNFYDWPKDDNIGIYFEILGNVLKGFDIKLAVLEKVHAMPKQGVKSMFSFGENFGMWKAFLAITQTSHLIIPPQQWMKGLVTKSDGATTKIAVQNVATRLFPEFKSDLFGSRGGYKDGRGDSLLMAVHARQLSGYTTS